MQYSPVPSPEGTKQTYWETKAPSSDVLGIGAGVSSGTFITSSVISFIVGGFCTGQVRAVMSCAFPPFAVPDVLSLFSVPIPRVSLPTSYLECTIIRTTRLYQQKSWWGSSVCLAGPKPRQELCTPGYIRVALSQLSTTPILHMFVPKNKLNTGDGGCV